MLGDRDSEIAVVIKEELNHESLMNRQMTQVSKYVTSLRIKLMGEHLGLTDNSFLLDPLDDNLFCYMKNTACSNSALYEEIFPNVYPTDKLLDLNDFEQKNNLNVDNKIILDKYNENSKKIMGNIVVFPLDFMKNEDLTRPALCKERLVPIKNFV